MRFQFRLQHRLLVLALLFATLAVLSFFNADGARSQTAPAMIKDPAVQNVWLMRQTEKILPPTCLAGSDIGALSEVLSGEVVGQALGAFSFEIEYDRHVACIVATPGDEFASAGATCTVEDSITAWWLRGFARVPHLSFDLGPRLRLRGGRAPLGLLGACDEPGELV